MRTDTDRERIRRRVRSSVPYVVLAVTLVVTGALGGAGYGWDGFSPHSPLDRVRYGVGLSDSSRRRHANDDVGERGLHRYGTERGLQIVPEIAPVLDAYRGPDEAIDQQQQQQQQQGAAGGRAC